MYVCIYKYYDNSCKAVTIEISFRVNHISISDVDVVNRGFTQQVQVTLSYIRKRKLLAKVIQDINNTNLLCKSINSLMVYSGIAVLRIQGEVIL